MWGGYNDVALDPAENIKLDVYFKYPRDYHLRVKKSPNSLDRTTLAFRFSLPIIDTSWLGNKRWNSLDIKLVNEEWKHPVEEERTYLGYGSKNPFPDPFEKGMTDRATLGRYRDAWRRAADRTTHGEPIVLGPGDFAS